MHGRTRHHLFWALAFLLAGVSGCADSSAASGCCSAPCFDAGTAGCIEGQVLWSGDSPSVAAFPYRFTPGLGDESAIARLRVNPFAPAIDPYSGAVSDAVVCLRGVDLRKARPWDHPPVVVEQRELQLHLLQGGRDGPIGFVRRGDSIDMLSREPRFHVLRARGASWFTLAFPDPDQPLSRPLDVSGIVELTSGAGYYWMRGYLLVDEHPYYTLTDAGGHFRLPGVPPGRYEIICWLPNWREIGHDRDPETGCVSRLSFAAPATVTRTVELKARQRRDVRFVLATRDF